LATPAKYILTLDKNVMMGGKEFERNISKGVQGEETGGKEREKDIKRGGECDDCYCVTEEVEKPQPGWQ